MYSLNTGLHLKSLRAHVGNIVTLHIAKDALISVCSKGLVINWAIPSFEINSQHELSETGKLRHAQVLDDERIVVNDEVEKEFRMYRESGDGYDLEKTLK